VSSPYTRHYATGFGYYLRAADGRRTRTYTTLAAAGRALARGELFSDEDYARARFWPTPGNPRPGEFQATPGRARRRAA
jgi:hypothetical protein